MKPLLVRIEAGIVVLLTALLAGATSPALAQFRPPMLVEAAPAQQPLEWFDPEVRYGLRGAMNVAGFRGEAAPGTETGAAPAGGAFVNLRFTPGFALQPEVLYGTRTATLHSSPLFEPADGVDLRLRTLDVPVLMKWYLPVVTDGSPNLFAGPEVSVRLSGEADDRGNVIGREDVTDDLRPVTYGVTLGAGLDRVAERGLASFDVRYTVGLSDLFDHADAALQQQTLRFTVGLGL